MFQFYYKLLTKQLGSQNFKILILDEYSYNIARALLPFEILRRLSICAISDMRTNINDLTAAAELVFILHPDSLGAMLYFIGGLIKYLKITIFFTERLPDVNADAQPQVSATYFKAFSVHLTTFMTQYMAISSIDVYLRAALDSVHSTGFSYISTVGKDQYITMLADSGPELTIISRSMFDFALPKVDVNGAAVILKGQPSLLFNKFRTFLTYGGLAFEFFELLQTYTESISLYDIASFVPGGRGEFFQSLQEDSLFYQYASMPLQDAISRNLETVKKYKTQKEKLYKTYNLSEIAELDRLKQQIDRSSLWLRKMLDICKILGLQYVKEFEDEVLSGPYGVELAKQKIEAFSPYCQSKLRLLYYLSYGKPLFGQQRCAFVVEYGGLLKSLKKCTLEGILSGNYYKQLDVFRKGVSYARSDKFVFCDSSMVFGELCQLNLECQVGCAACRPWQYFAYQLE